MFLSILHTESHPLQLWEPNSKEALNKSSLLSTSFHSLFPLSNVYSNSYLPMLV